MKADEKLTEICREIDAASRNERGEDALNFDSDTQILEIELLAAQLKALACRARMDGLGSALWDRIR